MPSDNEVNVALEAYWAPRIGNGWQRMRAALEAIEQLHTDKTTKQLHTALKTVKVPAAAEEEDQAMEG